MGRGRAGAGRPPLYDKGATQLLTVKVTGEQLGYLDRLRQIRGAQLGAEMTRGAWVREQIEREATAKGLNKGDDDAAK